MYHQNARTVLANFTPSEHGNPAMSKTLRTLSLVASGSSLWILAGHWFPFRKGFRRDMHRVEAYTYGVLGIIVPTLIAYRIAGTRDAAAILVTATVSAGAATVGSKAVDMAIEYSHEVADLKERLTYAPEKPVA